MCHLVVNNKTETPTRHICQYCPFRLRQRQTVELWAILHICRGRCGQ